MAFDYIPKVNLKGDISQTKLNTEGPGGSFRMGSVGNGIDSPSFKGVMMDLARNLDETIKAPDQVMQDAMLGNGADVHDVMIAMSKAEIGLNIATQITTKVIQSYEKVSSIQV